MTEGLSFSNPQEELSYLRSKVLEQEKRLDNSGIDKPRHDVVRDTLKEYSQSAHAYEGLHADSSREAQVLLQKHREVEIEEMVELTSKKGILHTLKTVEKLKGWRLEDEFHDYLARMIAHGMPIRGVDERGPIYKALHMSLYEIVLPKSDGKNEKALGELIKSMEQLYAGFLSVADGKKNEAGYMAFELANPDGAESTHMFVSVPSEKKDLFSRQLLSIFPHARLTPRENDYHIFNERGITLGAVAKLSNNPAYPLKTFESFGEDPLNVILSGFSKIPSDGSGASLQIIFRPRGSMYTERYLTALKQIQKGKKPEEVLKEASITSEIINFFSTSKKKDDEPVTIDQRALEAITKKIETPIVETNLRLAVSASEETEARRILENLESAFHQFENPGLQGLSWETIRSSKESDFYRAFTFRLFREGEALPLSLKELSTLFHLHTQALIQNSPLKSQTSKSAPAPTGLSNDGILLGINSYQGTETQIHISPEDRLRHLYVIGQTGTGKSSLLKNMIYEDIRAGNGVCMIDPHGNDIQDVLGYVPPERYEDVIYFDPASVERPMALNMLEYDRRFPEQKIFVVNELFSIFQKLYGGVPESMGPMFEQYFRNATMLVIEDPDSGCTLLDVSRVMSNKEYRDMKISRCKNPIVTQFWQEIATKAGGEGKLENIVPYITSKFDVFLANDIMRPIIAQEKSSFNFREIMDQKKILLVNLSKGRLGDINSNLIGLILVGKILMAALSRTDSLDRDLPPFYLTIDEFQNITTNSIATILSEARKYKLSLTVAHQFIAQIDEDIRNAVFGNVGSIAAFRVGNDDAEYLEKQFSPTFESRDIANIENLHAYVKMLVHGRATDPFDIKLMPWPETNKETAAKLKELSAIKYGRNREEVEKEIMEKYQSSLQSSIKKEQALNPLL